MKILTAQQTAERLPYPELIQRLSALFSQAPTAPDRHHHSMAMDGEVDATLLLMPAWNEQIGCVKIVTATPGNSARGLPAIAGSVLAFRRDTGEHIALLDGAVLTARRTAAASALAADKLARSDAKHLLIVGSGKVAQQLPPAYSAVRDIETISIWSRRNDSAVQLAEQLQQQGYRAKPVQNLSEAVAQADIISAATLAQQPIIQGQWLQPGQHLDLIGAFTPQMREADDLALQRSSIYMDTPFASRESGELKIPLASGAIHPDQLCGTLAELVKQNSARQSAEQITLFKSVGNAAMDLAATLTAMDTGDRP